jgi:hypothetical protein
VPSVPPLSPLPPLDPEVVAWIREQKRLRINGPTIRRMVLQLFGVEITDPVLRGIKS